MPSRRNCRRTVAGLFVSVAAAAGSSGAMAQNRVVEAGGHVGVLRLNELRTTDAGVGGDVVWHVAPAVAVDGALTWFPGTDGSTGASISGQQRALGLAGIRAGVMYGGVDLFAHGRAGFLRFGRQPATVCILIFPPPLACQLSAGYTAFATDLGGGASVGLIRSGRWRASIDAADLLVRYGLTSFRLNGTTTEGFISHNLLMSIGAAWRF